MIPLCYLWQRPQKTLLNEMINNNINAILVKVASMGLIPKKHLGKDINELYSHFIKLVLLCYLLYYSSA